MRDDDVNGHTRRIGHTDACRMYADCNVFYCIGVLFKVNGDDDFEMVNEIRDQPNVCTLPFPINTYQNSSCHSKYCR